MTPDYTKLANLHLQALPTGVRTALLAIQAAGGQAYLVGGIVRDSLLGKKSKDFDLEVHRLGQQEILQALRTVGTTKPVGKSFGIIEALVQGSALDISMPRLADGTSLQASASVVPLPEAAARRDYTLNALYFDPFSGELFDFFGGVHDLRNRHLRHIQNESFAQDWLRVLRGMKLCAHFKLSPAQTTLEFLQTQVPQESPWLAERAWHEWKSWTTSPFPSYGLEFLRKSGWIALYPELHATIDCPQDPLWHPEGDVWRHTLHCCDYAAKLAHRQKLSGEERQTLLFAMLCHDLGKPLCTTHHEDGHIHSAGHDQLGEKLAENFLQQIHAPIKLKQEVIRLTGMHMYHLHWASRFRTAHRATIQNLAERLHPSNIRAWERVVESDASGRPPHPPARPAQNWLTGAEELACADAPQASIISGAQLLKLGASPGPALGKLLKQARQAQLNDIFRDDEGALRWLAKHATSIRLLHGEDLLAMGTQEGRELGNLLQSAFQAQLRQEITTRAEALAWASRATRHTTDNLLPLLQQALPPARLHVLELIRQSSQTLGYPLYIVGGFVRDLLRNDPSLDYDLVVEGETAQLVQQLVHQHGGRATLHARFGTTSWELPPNLQAQTGLGILDFARSRTEHYPQPGSLPEVTPAPIAQDFQRRDFSINALAIDLGHDYGRLLDPFGGRADLHAGQLRTLHAQSFRDDPTRILRGLRFAKRFGYQCAPETWQLLKQERHFLKVISGDRIRHEIELMLAEPQARNMLLGLSEWELAMEISPALQNLALEAEAFWRAGTGLAGWLLLLPEQALASVQARLNLPVKVVQTLQGIQRLRAQQTRLQEATRPSEITHLLEKIPDDALQLAQRAPSFSAIQPTLEEYLNKYCRVTAPLTGDDLRALGLTPGAQFGRLLSEMRSAVLDGTLENDKNAAREWVRAKLAEGAI